MDNKSIKEGLHLLTTIVSVDNDGDNHLTYAQAVSALQAGEVVAFPTETVYGLGAVATNETAVAKIFQAKGRPSDNPLIVHIGEAEAVAQYAEHIPLVAQQCMEAFWPGALTLIVKAKPNIFATNVTAGLATVGIRMPNHPVALSLLQKTGLPIAAPSANRSGKPSPTKAEHVYHDLKGQIPLIIDGGATGIGLESTVLDVTQTPPIILRPGGVTKEMLQAVIGEVHEATLTDVKDAPRAPGMKYTHYSPEAPVYVTTLEDHTLQEMIIMHQTQHEKVALLAMSPTSLQADYVYDLGNSIDAMSIKLYDALRACDQTDATMIIVRAVPLQGVGTAIMNRLEKAAGGNRLIK